MWRYAEVLPVRDPAAVVTLGEGMTPLLPARRLGRALLDLPADDRTAVAIAAFLQVADQLQGTRVAIVLCGANISLETLKGVL